VECSWSLYLLKKVAVLIRAYNWLVLIRPTTGLGLRPGSTFLPRIVGRSRSALETGAPGGTETTRRRSRKSASALPSHRSRLPLLRLPSTRLVFRPSAEWCYLARRFRRRWGVPAEAAGLDPGEAVDTVLGLTRRRQQFHYHPIGHKNSSCALGLEPVYGRLFAESV
jgi:hypothetical protein